MYHANHNIKRPRQDLSRKNYSKNRKSMRSNLDILNLMGLFIQVQITRSANKFALRAIWTCKKVSKAKLWLEKAIKRIFDSEKCLRLEEFEISEFEISRVDCSLEPCETLSYLQNMMK